MAGLMDELINELDEERKIYTILLDIADQKTQIIINGDVPSLQQLTQNEQELAGRLYRLNQKRQELIKDIALVTNIDEKDLTVTKLTGLLSKEKSIHSKLTDITLQMQSIVNKFKKKNEQNKQLIQQSLDYIDFTFNALQSTYSMPDTNHYEHEGTVTQGVQKKSFFDAKQ